MGQHVPRELGERDDGQGARLFRPLELNAVPVFGNQVPIPAWEIVAGHVSSAFSERQFAKELCGFGVSST
jgi:hypothetical protein